jgi:hypothetical protein
MNFLPIAERELRLLTRKRRTFYARGVAALVVIVVCLGMLYAGFGGVMSAASAGRGLFMLLSCLAAAYVLIDGPLRTADCLSQEQRDGTLGLLFLTDLRGYDIVLGKFVSRVVNPAYCLLATLPALGIGLFLGGVTGYDVACMTLALMNGLFVAASLALCTSALCCSERRALGLALVAILSWSVLLPGIGFGLAAYRGTPVHPIFLVPSPAGAFIHALTSGQTAGTTVFSFFQSLVVTHVIGWCFLVAASWILPRTWPGGVTSPANTWLKTAWPKTKSKPAGISIYFQRHRWMEANPFLWAGDRPGQRGLGVWPAFLVLGVLWLFGRIYDPTSWKPMPVYPATVLVLHLVLMYSVAVHACRRPAQDQQSGVLELLLTTPLGADVYLRGQLLSLKRQTFRPLLFVLAVDLTLMVAGCWESGSLNWEWLGWAAGFLLLSAKLLLDLYTLSWVGFWQGLASRSTSHALRRTIFYVFLLRWILLLTLLGTVGLLTQGRVFQSPAGGAIASGGYIALLIMTVVYYCGRAMGELHDDLRTLALQFGGAR